MNEHEYLALHLSVLFIFKNGFTYPPLKRVTTGSVCYDYMKPNNALHCTSLSTIIVQSRLSYGRICLIKGKKELHNEYTG